MRPKSNSTDPALEADAEHDDGDIVRLGMAIEVKVINAEERTIDVIASTEDLDSHGDIVRQFWDFTRYDLNPVVLWLHNMFESSRWAMGGVVDPSDMLPIGKSIKHEVKGKKLVATLQLVKSAPGEEPLVDKLWRRIEQGIQRAVSVGFRPGSILAVTDKKGNFSHYELGSEDRPNELHEISFVPMGSNPKAVAKSIAAGREQLGRILATRNAAVTGDKRKAPTMTEQEKAAFEKALADAKAADERAKAIETRATTAETALATERTRATGLEAELAAEKALAKQGADELAKANERAAKAEARVTKSELDARQGKKFAPADREIFEALVAAKGLDYVIEKLDARGDLAITQEIEVDGKKLNDSTQTTPPASDGSTPEKDEILEIANKAAAEVRARA